MREILFRGKEIKTGKWVYGDLRQYVNIPFSSDFLVIDTMPTEKGFGTAYDVYKNTIGQFTGLCDKNGNKIFEGDICRVKYKEIRNYTGVKYDDFMEFNEVVVYNEDFGGFCFMIVDDGIKMYRPIWKNQSNEKIKIEKYEVIGNIYNNLELLGDNDV